MDRRKAIVLLSGGLDSTTALALTKSWGFEIYALTFKYGQRHSYEIEAALRIAKEFGVGEHIIVQFDLRRFGGSALLSDSDEIPRDRRADEIGSGIPATYVPARNMIFLAFAVSWAEALGASDIVIGVNAIDYSGYPDCRPEFIEEFLRLARLGTRVGVEGGDELRIHTPLIQLTKAEIIRLGISLGVDYAKTSSCYDPSESGEACGRCDACLLRLTGFREIGIADPLTYKQVS